MMRIAAVLSLAVVLALASCSQEAKEPEAQKKDAAQMEVQAYTPQAQFCVTGGSQLCPTIPGNIGPDPALDRVEGYSGLEGSPPKTAAEDSQTPFDNLSWQTFVALNWTKGKENQPAGQGLQGSGPRVWEGWKRVSDVFGNGPVPAPCGAPDPGETVFFIASNGAGKLVANNEEYIQAATGDPLIDVEGNWTIYERRLNDVEVAYLQAPRGQTKYSLTTYQGQVNLITDNIPVDFPAVKAGAAAATGAIELKAAWRVLDRKQRAQNQKRFYVVPALLKVPSDLVRQRTPICAHVDMGLVAMHIIQKNPPTNNALKPQWFWSTFEHVDNAPLAKNPCDPTLKGNCVWLNAPKPKLPNNCTANLPAIRPNYSFFNADFPQVPVNQQPTASAPYPYYAWNATVPYAKDYVTSIPGGIWFGTQVSRCWQIYTLTDQLNTQWRVALSRVGSVFQNYMLVGTQWGAGLETFIPDTPPDAVPRLLSNTVVETYLQALSDTDPKDPNAPFNTGSCIHCHAAATLKAGKPPSGTSVSSDLSFLPYLVRKPGSLPLDRKEMLEGLKRRHQEMQRQQQAAPKP